MPTADIYECPPSPPCPPPPIPPAPPLPPCTMPPCPTPPYYIPPAPPLPPPGYLLPNYTGPCPIPKPCPPAPPLPPKEPKPTKRPGLVRPSAEEISRATLRKTNFTRRPKIIGNPNGMPDGFLRPSAEEISRATLRPVGHPNWYDNCFVKGKRQRSQGCTGPFPDKCRKQKMTSLEFSQEDSEKCLSSSTATRNLGVAEISRSLRLRDYERPLCTGAIITRHLVVTSAHCVYWAKDAVESHANLQVVAGAVSFYNDFENQIRNVKEILTPTEYKKDKKLFGKDIAILVLKKDLDLNEHVKMINLPPENYQPPVSQICATYGWGQVDKEMKVNKLIAAHFKVKDVYQCRNLLWKGIDSMKKRAGKMTCAGFSGARFCPGDHGAPLVCEVGPDPAVLAAISYWNHDKRLNCKKMKNSRPQMYTNIGPFIPWINTIIIKQDQLRKDRNGNSSLKVTNCIGILILSILLNREVSK
eukprot:10759.XXX_294191_292609_1 [CDS] Oithona nana genome sequencing.